MSGLLGLLLVSVSVGLSNFAGAIGIGLSGINARTRIRVGIAFGFFEALMPLIGLVLGEAVAGYIGHHLAGYVAGGILPRFKDALAASAFRQRFESKGRFSSMLAKMPTWLILEESPALIGLANMPLP